MPRGFTLLEAVLVIALLAILFGVGWEAGSILQNALAARGARQVEHLLLLASQRARDGVGGTSWGVYFEYDAATRVPVQAVIFSGASYASRDPDDDIRFALPANLRLEDVSLGGAGATTGDDHEVVFSPLSGATSDYGSMTIEAFESVTEIEISSIGIAVRE